MDLATEILRKHNRHNNDLRASEIINLYETHQDKTHSMPALKGWQFTSERFLFLKSDDKISIYFTDEVQAKHDIEYLTKTSRQIPHCELRLGGNKNDMYGYLQFVLETKKENAPEYDGSIIDNGEFKLENIPEERNEFETKLSGRVYDGRKQVLSRLGIKSTRIYVPTEKTINTLLKQKETNAIILPGLMHGIHDGLNYIAGYTGINQEHKPYVSFPPKRKDN
ncbi:MAG TPA: hypothetical protein VEC16_04995 [Alphaproteobacteria bacterium]|nr:hypothetical protein [Alphaproteobacteria bacterium]